MWNESAICFRLFELRVRAAAITTFSCPAVTMVPALGGVGRSSAARADDGIAGNAASSKSGVYHAKRVMCESPCEPAMRYEGAGVGRVVGSSRENKERRVVSQFVVQAARLPLGVRAGEPP